MYKPGRVVAEHRGAVIAHDGINEHRLKLGRQLTNSRDQRKPATGDWLLVDLNREQLWRVLSPKNK